MDNNEKVLYFSSTNQTIDIVLHKKVNTAYPLHTHAEHYTIGIVCDSEYFCLEQSAPNGN